MNDFLKAKQARLDNALLGHVYNHVHGKQTKEQRQNTASEINRIQREKLGLRA